MVWFTALIASAFTIYLLLTLGKKSIYDKQIAEVGDLMIAAAVALAIILLTLA